MKLASFLCQPIAFFAAVSIICGVFANNFSPSDIDRVVESNSILPNGGSSSNQVSSVSFPGIQDQAFGSDCLVLHNELRRYDVEAQPLSPLVWRVELATAAQKYANYLRDRGRNIAQSSKLVHSQWVYGENLFWQSGGMDKSCKYAVQKWYDEKSMYAAGTKIPNNSPKGYTFKDYGHYTQIVWKSTRSVGCAYADDGAERYVVCEYWPHGNMIGEAAY